MGDLTWLADRFYVGPVRVQLTVTAVLFAAFVAVTVFLAVRAVRKRGGDEN